MPRLYLTPFIGNFDVDILSARAHFAIIKRAAMKILTAELTNLISPLGIALVSESGINEQQEQQETHWCLREGLQDGFIVSRI
jgi:hypothetical protein